MRLDHLLSKEHWSRKLIQSLVCQAYVADSGCSRVEHRLFGADLASCTQVQAGPFGGGQWNAVGAGAAPDTLLGPEGSGESSTSRAG